MSLLNPPVRKLLDQTQSSHVTIYCTAVVWKIKTIGETVEINKEGMNGIFRLFSQVTNV